MPTSCTCSHVLPMLLLLNPSPTPDPSKQDLRYFSFSLNELGINDIPAQLDHLHTGEQCLGVACAWVVAFAWLCVCGGVGGGVGGGGGGHPTSQEKEAERRDGHMVMNMVMYMVKLNLAIRIMYILVTE